MGRPAVLLCLVVLLGQLLTASGTIFGSDGARRFQVTQSLVHHGWVDIQTEDLAPVGQDGRRYAQYAIGHSLAMAPFYLLGIQAARLFPSRREELVEFCVSSVNLLATAVLAGLLCLFAQALGFLPGTGVALGLLYAFGTMAWQQSKDSFEHPQIALYLTTLFFLLHRFSRTRRFSTLWAAGTVLGLALLTRYTSFLAYPSVIVFFAVLAWQNPVGRRFLPWVRWLSCFFLSQIPFVAFDLWFNAVRFGSVFETGQQQLFGNIFKDGHLLAGLWGLTFRWEYGLIPFNPVLILWPIGLFLMVREQKALVGALITLVVCFPVFYGSTKAVLWTGGWAWGPRFLVDLLPLLVLTCAPVLEGVRQRCTGRRWAPVMFRLLIVLSVCIQLQSVLVNYNRGFTKRALQVQGHSFQASGFRESPLFLQAENIGEISHSYLQGRFPACHQRSSVFTSLASLDRSISFGSYQLWWVYALHCGAPAPVILLYLLLTGLALFLLARRIRDSLQGPAGP